MSVRIVPLLTTLPQKVVVPPAVLTRAPGPFLTAPLMLVTADSAMLPELSNPPLTIRLPLPAIRPPGLLVRAPVNSTVPPESWICPWFTLLPPVKPDGRLVKARTRPPGAFVKGALIWPAAADGAAVGQRGGGEPAALHGEARARRNARVVGHVHVLPEGNVSALPNSPLLLMLRLSLVRSNVPLLELEPGKG